MRFKKATAVLLIFMLTIAVFAVSPYTGGLVSAEESDEAQMADKQKKLEENRRQLEDLKNQQNKETEYQLALLQDMRDTQDLLDAYIQQVERLDAEIAEKEESIANKEDDLENKKETFKARLRAMYISGNTSTLEVLLGSTDFGDFLARTELVQSVSEHDKELIDELVAAIEEIQEEKNQLEADLVLAKEKKDEVEAQKLVLTEKVAASQEAIRQISQKAEHIEAEMRKEQEIEQKIRNSNSKMTGGASDSWSGGYAGGADPVNGLFRWPVPTIGTISSGYQYRWGKMHKGIDISGGANTYGSDIVAARSGTVSLVDNMQTSTYGKYLMIDHGYIGGTHYATLYAHCSSIKVSEGDKVLAGQTIALIGNTGWSTGPHCHFEIRVNGSTVNPKNYVSY